MGITLHWFLPTSGDSRNVVPGLGGHSRPASIDYLGQIARAAENLGFDAVLTPTGTGCEDAWLVTSALSQHTTRLRFLVAFRPGITNPTLAAQQATTFQRMTNGRLLVNIVTGGDALEQQRFGDWLSHDERYARTDEFLKILRGAWSGAPFVVEGWHYKITGATSLAPPDPVPEVYFDGASTVAEDVAARNVDVYLRWGEPPAMARERMERVRAKRAWARRVHTQLVGSSRQHRLLRRPVGRSCRNGGDTVEWHIRRQVGQSGLCHGPGLGRLARTRHRGSGRT